MKTIQGYLNYCRIMEKKSNDAKCLNEYCNKIKTFEEYKNQADKTANKLLDTYDNLLEGVMGLNGETGEVTDLIKKFFYQGHDLEKNRIIEECGDTLWYLNLILQSVGASLEECANINIEKLSRRYPNGFSVEKSRNRKKAR